MFGMAAGAQEKTPAEVYFDKGKLHLRSKDDGSMNSTATSQSL